MIHQIRRKWFRLLGLLNKTKMKMKMSLMIKKKFKRLITKLTNKYYKTYDLK